MRLSPDPAENNFRCEKNWHPSKRAAKAALRRHHDPTHTFGSCRAYYCAGCDGWHLGHLPAAVIAGRSTKAQAFGTRAA